MKRNLVSFTSSPGEEVKGVGVMKDEDLNLEEIETFHTLRHVTGPFPVSPVPALAGEVAHRYRLYPVKW